jgi:hypothetical protein
VSRVRGRQDEAIASYLGYTVTGGAWDAFCYREKERAYAADSLPGRQPVSSPVASAADAIFRQVELTYSKGAAVAWEMALDGNQDRRTAEAAAHGIWVPGQEAVLGPLLAGFRERYFAEAVPVLDGRAAVGVSAIRRCYSSRAAASAGTSTE